MFSKVRRTAAVLSASSEKVEFPNISQIPNYGEIVRQRGKREGLPQPRPFNPVIRVIEATVVGLISAFTVTPLMYLMTSSQGKINSVITGVFTVALYVAWENLGVSITGKIGRLVRLDFLDPYVGNRVKRTIRIFKGENGATQTPS